MSEPRADFSLGKNLALMAGAGAGKTYNLVTHCLHLLGGAGRPALRPAQLCVLTFTDKAASELRTRLRQRLDGLARAAARERAEPELRDSFAAAGRPFPPAETWRRLLDDLGAATVGTFHSLCSQLLRRAPAGFGIDPAFELLDERDAQALIRDVAEREVLDALEREEPLVVELCQELQFAARGGFNAMGLVDALVNVFGKTREEGLDAAGIEIESREAARERFDSLVRDARATVASASAADFRSGGKCAHVFRTCQLGFDGLTFENCLEPNRVPAMRTAFRTLRKTMKRLTGGLKEVEQLVEPDRGDSGVLQQWAACQVVEHEEVFRELVGRLARRHREELRRRGALDFSEMLIRTRDLLRDELSVRRDVRSRYSALLVDEFQDTNRLQLEIVTLIAERREGGPRAVVVSSVGDGSALEVPLEPGFLCAVGDRKQSIYEFRGADVAVFSTLAAKIEAEGGERRFLTTNRRSSPELLEFFNGLFARVMALRPDARDYEVAYRPDGDDLKPHRSQRELGSAVEWIDYEPAKKALDARLQDAELVARRVKHMLSARPGLKVERDGQLRKPEGRDIAILFRRFTYLEMYRQALVRAGVPHRVIRGRGFYGAQEVMDLASFLALLSNPADSLALAAVLRSPLVALSDASLLKVSLEAKQLTVDAVAQRESKWSLSTGEQARLGGFLETFAQLRRERDRLGIATLLEVALERTGYRLAVAGTPYGEQALSNLEKLVALARRRDQSGIGECSKFAAELWALAESDPTEAQADVLDASDRRAVQLLTIHQAKGLEWPIVLVPDMAQKPMNVAGKVLFDRRRGLAIRPWIRGEELTCRPPRLEEIRDEIKRREAAEHRRLLYVALTRARDHLVMSGATSRRSPGCWREIIDEALAADPALAARVTRVTADELPSLREPPPPQTALGMEGWDEIEAIERRVNDRRPASAKDAVFPVTQLQDYFLCPRRFLYAHQLGLGEFPSVFELEAEVPDEPSRSVADPRVRGTIAHGLLEKLELALIGDERKLRQRIDEMLWAEALDPKQADAVEIAEWVMAFLRTPFAARMKEAGPSRVHRELPFLLRIGTGDGLAVHLKGQIDLLVEEADGSATVVDYKSSQRHPTGLTPYAFQLDCYTLAAKRFVKEGVPIRSGIAFLREREPGPDFRDRGTASELDGFEARLVAGAGELLQRSIGSEWPGRPEPECVALHCGYRGRCHARSPA